MTPPHDLRTALLLGEDHIELGDVAIREITPKVAIGISCGRFPKGYPHLDPNEDAVFAASDGDTTILAVADGHQGFDAAREAIAAIASAAPSLISSDPNSIVRELGTAAIAAVASKVPAFDPPRSRSRTALSICAIRGGNLATSTAGDTACFVARKGRARRIGASSPFLSPNTDPGSMQIDVVALSPRSSIFVASDGLVDFVKPLHRTLRSATRQLPRDAVDLLMAAAFAGGAGDNIALGVARPSV